MHLHRRAECDVRGRVADHQADRFALDPEIMDFFIPVREALGWQRHSGGLGFMGLNGDSPESNELLARPINF